MQNPTHEILLSQLTRIRESASHDEADATALEGRYALSKLQLLHKIAPTLADDDYLAMLWVMDRKTYILDANHISELAHAECALQNARFAAVKASEPARTTTPEPTWGTWIPMGDHQRVQNELAERSKQLADTSWRLATEIQARDALIRTRDEVAEVLGRACGSPTITILDAAKQLAGEFRRVSDEWANCERRKATLLDRLDELAQQRDKEIARVAELVTELETLGKHVTVVAAERDGALDLAQVDRDHAERRIQELEQQLANLTGSIKTLDPLNDQVR